MAQNYDYDVLYIGAGHGSFDGALVLAQRGLKLGVVEEDKIGGTCPNWGCNAKIALDAPVKVTREQERLKNIVNGETSIDWSENMKHKHQIIDGLPDGIGGLMKQAGIDIINGRGVLKDGHTVQVGDETKTADKIVVATGLRPHRLNIPGTELAHDSKEFLNLDKLPNRITIIGTGYISMEFATIANEAGADVTVMAHGDKALRQFYQPYVKKVVDDLSKHGVKFVWNADVSAFKESGDHVAVEYDDGKTEETDWILDSTGRIPNVENIGLDDVGVKYGKHGIQVNNYLQTSVDSIYASGDVADNGQPNLTPAAQFESSYLTDLFSGETKDPIDYPIIPSVVFTSPRIAQFGVPIDEAENDDQYDVVHNDLTSDWYRQVDNEQIADISLVFDKQHHLVGVTEVSDKAEDVIDNLLPVAELKLSPKQAKRIVHLFPTIASDAWLNL